MTNNINSKEVWHGITDSGFRPHPQNTFKNMKIVIEVNGGGWIWHKSFTKIALRIK